MATKSSRHETSHERILEVAARTLRRSGYSGVGVADVMKQAGLTHGGFYAHFESRDALLSEAIAHAGKDNEDRMSRRMDIGMGQAHDQSPLRTIIESYLSEAHMKNPEEGCVVAALSSEMMHQSPALLAPATEQVRALIARIHRALPEGGTQEQATFITSTLVGTLQLARALGGGAQSKAMLATARTTLLTQYEKQ